MELTPSTGPHAVSYDIQSRLKMHLCSLLYCLSAITKRQENQADLLHLTMEDYDSNLKGAYDPHYITKMAL